jgi:MYXO-CTERM domain-containing protein
LEITMIRTSGHLRRVALLGGLAAAGLVVWALPAVARACSCDASVTILAPADGATAPANALVLLTSFCGGSPDELEVLVDGVPASLGIDPERAAGLGFRIVPEPAPGALVEIAGCPGWESCEQALEQTGQEAWNKVELSFTATERDEQAPAAPVIQGLDYVIAEGECSYEEPPRPARDWSFTVDGQAEEQPLVYHLSLGPTGGSEPTESWYVALDGEEDAERTLRRFQEDAGSEVCLTVRTFDLAGNEAEAASSCQELARRETLDGEGCACSSDGGRHGWSAAMLLVIAGAWSRRRRR